jgi:1,2-diacylglycerol 3-beta-galactosyltransferase
LEPDDVIDTTNRGQVDVIPLGFVTDVPEYMVAADVLVSKAGPGTIAEAASVGLPVMMTR